jgi:signal transduction histidine kinase
VFDIFTRLQNRQNHSGSGIGLAICKKITDRLGGDIHNQPNELGGTDFIFTLPVS